MSAIKTCHLDNYLNRTKNYQNKFKTTDHVVERRWENCKNDDKLKKK